MIVVGFTGDLFGRNSKIVGIVLVAGDIHRLPILPEQFFRKVVQQDLVADFRRLQNGLKSLDLGSAADVLSRQCGDLPLKFFQRFHFVCHG
jgi:hypothetical protein